MRLTLIISSMGCGGAERVMSTMANYWAKKGWQVTLLTLDDGNEPPFYKLDPAICHKPLGISGNSRNPIEALSSNFRRLWILRKAIQRSEPQGIISFIEKMNVLTLLAIRGLELPVIISERTNPARYPISKVWSLLRTWTYPLADRLVVQSRTVLEFFPQKIRQITHIIPNPITLNSMKNVLDASPEENGVIAMGRLSHEKGFDLLMEAFATVSKKHRDWKLTIWGEGKLRPELEQLREELRLTDRVHLPGRTSDASGEMGKASLFVLSSRFEGFPNVLCEAMACGLPVISFNCPSGPSDIIRDGIDGVLVPPENIEALSEAMDRLMSDKPEGEKLASRAPEVLDRFSLEKVMGMWEDLLTDIIGETT